MTDIKIKNLAKNPPSGGIPAKEKSKIKNEITLKIENNSITSSLKNILNNFDIEDLFINEPPIDEVIGKVLIKKNYDI